MPSPASLVCYQPLDTPAGGGRGGGLWLGSPAPGGNPPVRVPRLLCTPPPPLGAGARGPGMQNKGVTDEETHLEKRKVLFSIEPVGDPQLIGISGFL